MNAPGKSPQSPQPGAPDETAHSLQRGTENPTTVVSGGGVSVSHSATHHHEETVETETVDRDAMHQADYGGARGPADEQQGGFASDEAAGGGRKPTGARDRDYDPDGDRSGR